MRRHRSFERGRIYYPERQRVVVLEFPTVDDARAWDAAGQPIEIHTTTTEALKEPA